MGQGNAKEVVMDNSICDWFDPNDKEHILAYKQMQDTGMWPKDFYKKIQSKKLVFPAGWHSILAFKLANKWIDFMLVVRS